MFYWITVLWHSGLFFDGQLLKSDEMTDAHHMLPTRINLRAEQSGIYSHIANSNMVSKYLLW